MSKKQQQAIVMAEELFVHFHEKYGATREEVTIAIHHVGHVKPKIDAYFLVKAFEKKKSV